MPRVRLASSLVLLALVLSVSGRSRASGYSAKTCADLGLKPFGQLHRLEEWSPSKLEFKAVSGESRQVRIIRRSRAGHVGELVATTGQPLCVGDRLEVWHDGRALVTESGKGASGGVILRTLRAEPGAVVEVGPTIRQFRGAATYFSWDDFLYEDDDGPQMLVEIGTSGNGIASAESTFRVEVDDPCACKVKVAVSELNDPLTPSSSRRAHGVLFIGVDAQGRRFKEAVAGGQAVAFNMGESQGRRGSPVERLSAAETADVLKTVGEAHEALVEPLSGVTSRPLPEAYVETGGSGGPTGETWTTTAIPDAPMTFIGLSGGTYLMGRPAGETGDDDELPQHTVTVSGFKMAKSEVTQAQWAAVVQAAQAKGDPDAKSLNIKQSYFTGDTLPVEQVSWCKTARFANALSRLEGLSAAYIVGEDCEKRGEVAWDHAATGFRLPTEAEWEYAARAGTETAYSFGDRPNQLCTYANVADKTAKKSNPGWIIPRCDDGFAGTAPVCSFKTNPWGLCDLHGNVWEWTWDWYGDYQIAETGNPSGARFGFDHVSRGGSWFDWPDYARSASRNWKLYSFTGHNLGFRLVLPPVAVAEP